MARRRVKGTTLAERIGMLETRAWENEGQIVRRVGIEVSWARIANIMISGEAVESSNFVTGSTGWQIDGDGNAEFNNVIIRGSIYVMPSGTSFPLTPEDGEMFHRTDQNRVYRYDLGGLAWLPMDYIDSGARIANAIIGTAHIDNLAVTNAKINDLDAVKITAGTISAARIGAGTIDATKLNVTSLDAITATMGTLTVNNDLTISTGNLYSGSTATHHLTIGAIAGPRFIGWRNGATVRANIGVGTGTYPILSISAHTSGTVPTTQTMFEISAGSAPGKGYLDLYVGLRSMSSQTYWWGPDGTAGNPGFGFVNDPDTGMFRPAGNTVALVAGGTHGLQVNVNYWYSLSTGSGKPAFRHSVAGTSLLPTYTWTGDTNTGGYWESSGKESWTSDGSRRMTRNATGHSIGGGAVPTAIPVDALHVTSGSTQAAGRFYRLTASSNQQVLQVRSNVVSAEALEWHVDSDGDAVKASDPKHKHGIQDARSYWDDFKRIELITFTKAKKRGALRQVGYNADNIASIWPKLAREYKYDADGKTKTQRMVNLTAIDIIKASILQEAIQRIESLEQEVQELRKVA